MQRCLNVMAAILAVGYILATDWLPTAVSAVSIQDAQ
jgi:hypothetical protein